MKNNLFIFLFIVIVIILGLFATYSIYWSKEEVEENKIENTEKEAADIRNDIRLGIAEYDSLNPIVSKNKYVQEISKIIFEPLITITSDFKPEGVLAKEWSKLNETTYLVKLREKVLWHDGDIFTANDVQFTIDRLKEGKSIYSSNVDKINNVEVIDNETIKIFLTEEVPFFEYNLTFPILAAHQYVIEDFWTSTRMAAGTGMYKVREIKEKEFILKENKNWWNWKKSFKTQNIHINLYNSVGELYNAFKLGNIDLVNSANLNLQEYIGTIGYNIKEYKGREWSYLALNTSNSILNQKEIRQSIEHSIDKSNLIANSYGNQAFISNFPLDFGTYLYNSDTVEVRYNSDLSKQILIDNGWKYNYGTWRKTVNYKYLKTSFNLVTKSSNSIQVSLSETIKKQLKDVGFDIQIIYASDEQYYNYLANKNYDMILIGINSPININIENFIGKENYSNYLNNQIDELLFEAKNTQDLNKIKENINKIAEIYLDEVPWIALNFNKNYIAYSTKLRAEMKPNWFNIFYNINEWYREV